MKRMKSGFTLLELLVSLTLLVTATSILWSTFSQITRATQKGAKLLDSLHHGDFVMEQLTTGLRSSAFFFSAPEKYGFWLDDKDAGGNPADIVSWVTSSDAFIPIGSPLKHGLHRIYLSIEDTDDGGYALAASAYPHLINPEDDDIEEVEPWIISRNIVGLDCRVYNEDDDSWDDDWEDENNSLPRFVEITLFIKPEDPQEDPKELVRVVDIPVAIFAGDQSNLVDDSALEEGAPDEGINPGRIDPSPNAEGFEDPIIP